MPGMVIGSSLSYVGEAEVGATDTSVVVKIFRRLATMLNRIGSRRR